MSLYRQEIIEHWRFPRHKGTMKDADAQGEAANSLCGDDLILYLKLDTQSGILQNAMFEGEGCALMRASADILCDYIIGKETEDLSAFSANDFLKLYGEPPTPSRLKCVLLPYEALKRASVFPLS